MGDRWHGGSLDKDAIAEELAHLQREKEETKQRLDAFRPARLGGRLGPPRHVQRGEPGPGAGPQNERPLRSAGSFDGPGRRGGVFSRLAGGALGAGSRASSGSLPDAPPPPGSRYRDSFQHDDRVRDPGPAMGPPPRRRYSMHSDHDDRDGISRFGSLSGDIPNGSSQRSESTKRRALSSAVVVADAEDSQGAGGDGDRPSHSGDEGDGDRWAPGGDEPRKRRAAEPEPPAPSAEDDSRTKKRAKRMFGVLLGTLQRFREEDAQFAHSDVAAKRNEALRKADERERQQSMELRRKEAEARAALRSAELDKLAALSLATDTKVLELLYASRITRKEQLAKFLVTKSHPPVYWTPGKPSEVTDKLAEQQQDDLQVWKISLLEELEREKQGLVERSKARREAALARRAAREERIASLRAAGGSGTGAEAGPLVMSREEDEEEKTLTVGEYAVMPKARGGQEEDGDHPQGEGTGGDGYAVEGSGGDKDKVESEGMEEGEASPNAAMQEDESQEEEESEEQEEENRDKEMKEPTTVEDLLL